MADVDPEIKEHEVAGWPGWTKIVINNSRRYVSPGGTNISAARFMKLANLHKGEKYIPESEVPAPEPSRSFFKNVSTPKKQEPPDDVPRQQEFVELATDNESRSKPTSRRTKHPRPDAKMLGFGFKKLVLLLTAGIFAKLMNDDRLALSEEESTILGVALGNLFEPTDWNDKYGWLVTETGDWQAVGYILWIYGHRVNEVLKERTAARRAQKQGVPQQQYQPQPQAQPTSSNGNQPVPFHVGQGRVTPPGVGNQLGA